MKKLFIIAAFLFVISFTFQESSTQNFNSVKSSLVCEDYWFEIIEEDGLNWLYEYCGDKVISISPIYDED